MLYSVTAEIQKKNTGKKYMEPDIHENTELVSVEYKKTEKGSELIAFNFINALDEQFAHTEWRVMPTKNIATMSEKEQELYIRLVTGQISRINKIVTTFIPEEKMREVKGVTFEEFCLNTIKALGDANKGVKIRIKVVYDKRNFTALPSYTNYEWIEPMTIPKSESKIKILGKDKMEKSLPKKLEGADEKENEIEIKATAVPKNTEDDLPF